MTMQIIKMRKTGKRLAVSDRKAGLFVRMGVADLLDKPVVKQPLPADPDPIDQGSEPEDKPIRRRYRRRDMDAEEG